MELTVAIPRADGCRLVVKLTESSIDWLIYLSNDYLFSDEEGYGKYLDLHECYDKFINLKVTI